MQPLMESVIRPRELLPACRLVLDDGAHLVLDGQNQTELIAQCELTTYSLGGFW